MSATPLATVADVSHPVLQQGKHVRDPNLLDEAGMAFASRFYGAYAQSKSGASFSVCTLDAEAAPVGHGCALARCDERESISPGYLLSNQALRRTSLHADPKEKDAEATETIYASPRVRTAPLNPR